MKSNFTWIALFFHENILFQAYCIFVAVMTATTETSCHTPSVCVLLCCSAHLPQTLSQQTWNSGWMETLAAFNNTAWLNGGRHCNLQENKQHRRNSERDILALPILFTYFVTWRWLCCSIQCSLHWRPLEMITKSSKNSLINKCIEISW